jgi:hypothetical protein
MPVQPITLAELNDALSKDNTTRLKQTRSWCAGLESGAILYFPRTPVPIPEDDLSFLLGRSQTCSKLHKNIAYNPGRDRLTGAGAKSATPAIVEQFRAVMRRYSAAVARFQVQFLAPYEMRWVLDFASYRPVEEAGRDLPLRHRNDLLHTDSFPTRPTRGWRILRFFHNIHPTRTRNWMVGEPFPVLVGAFVPKKLPIPRPDSPLARAGRKLAQGTGLAKLAPQWKRTPYDEFMMRLHNTMKEDEHFQRSCLKEYVEFAPGSSWMVYTETVPHAALAGQYALEQTFLVDPSVMISRELTPVAVLEKMAGGHLA